MSVELLSLRYCSDVCSGTTCHTEIEISSGRKTIYHLSFNKTNCDHLIYELQDISQVFKNIKLGPMSVFVSQISDWVYSFKKIKYLKNSLPTDDMGS